MGAVGTHARLLESLSSQVSAGVGVERSLNSSAGTPPLYTAAVAAAQKAAASSERQLDLLDKIVGLAS